MVPASPASGGRTTVDEAGNAGAELRKIWYDPPPPLQESLSVPALSAAMTLIKVVTVTWPTIPKPQCGLQKKGSTCGVSRNCRVKDGDVEVSDAFQTRLARQGLPLVVVCARVVPVRTIQRTWSPCSIVSVAGLKLNALEVLEMATRGVAMSTPGSTARVGRANNDRARTIAPGMLPLRVGFLTGRSSLFCTGRFMGHFRCTDKVPPDSQADNQRGRAAHGRQRKAWVRLILKPSRYSLWPASRSPPGTYWSVSIPCTLVRTIWKTCRVVAMPTPIEADWNGAFTPEVWPMYSAISAILALKRHSRPPPTAAVPPVSVGSNAAVWVT